MEELWVRVFSCDLRSDVYSKMLEEPEFKLTSENIHEYIDKAWVLELLRDNNIEYKISIEEAWLGIKRPRYKNKVIVHVKNIDVNEAKRLIAEFE